MSLGLSSTHLYVEIIPSLLYKVLGDLWISFSLIQVDLICQCEEVRTLSWPDIIKQQWHLLDLWKGTCTLSALFCTFIINQCLYTQRLSLLLAKSNEDIIVVIYLTSLQVTMKNGYMHVCTCRLCRYVCLHISACWICMQISVGCSPVSVGAKPIWCPQTCFSIEH